MHPVETTIRGLYEDFNRADLDGVLKRVEHGTRWYTLDKTLQPRLYSGKAGVRRFLTEMLGSQRELTVETDDLVTASDCVLACIRLRAPQARPGTGYPVFHLWDASAGGLIARHRLYLNPAKALRALHGSSPPNVTADYRVDPAAIRLYAEAVHETDPIYYDAAAAKAAGFDGMVAPPMFAAVYSAEAVWSVVVSAMGDAGLPLVHSDQELVWSRPVHAGDEITTHAWRDDLAADDPLGRREFRSVSWNQHAQVVVRGTWTVLTKERP